MGLTLVSCRALYEYLPPPLPNDTQLFKNPHLESHIVGMLPPQPDSSLSDTLELTNPEPIQLIDVRFEEKQSGENSGEYFSEPPYPTGDKVGILLFPQNVSSPTTFQDIPSEKNESQEYSELNNPTGGNDGIFLSSSTGFDGIPSENELSSEIFEPNLKNTLQPGQEAVDKVFVLIPTQDFPLSINPMNVLLKENLSLKNPENNIENSESILKNTVKPVGPIENKVGILTNHTSMGILGMGTTFEENKSPVFEPILKNITSELENLIVNRNDILLNPLNMSISTAVVGVPANQVGISIIPSQNISLSISSVDRLSEENKSEENSEISTSEFEDPIEDENDNLFSSQKDSLVCGCQKNAEPILENNTSELEKPTVDKNDVLLHSQNMSVLTAVVDVPPKEKNFQEENFKPILVNRIELAGQVDISTPFENNSLSVIPVYKPSEENKSQKDAESLLGNNTSELEKPIVDKSDILLHFQNMSVSTAVEGVLPKEKNQVENFKPILVNRIELAGQVDISTPFENNSLSVIPVDIPSEENKSQKNAESLLGNNTSELEKPIVDKSDILLHFQNMSVSTAVEGVLPKEKNQVENFNPILVNRIELAGQVDISTPFKNDSLSVISVDKPSEENKSQKNAEPLLGNNTSELEKPIVDKSDILLHSQNMSVSTAEEKNFQVENIKPILVNKLEPADQVSNDSLPVAVVDILSEEKKNQENNNPNSEKIFKHLKENYSESMEGDDFELPLKNHPLSSNKNTTLLHAVNQDTFRPVTKRPRRFRSCASCNIPK